MGRTGVFIALDHLIQHVRDHDFVDIYGLVAELRSERMCMVQNLVSSHQIQKGILFLRGYISEPRENKLKDKNRGLIQYVVLSCSSALKNPQRLTNGAVVVLFLLHVLL